MKFDDAERVLVAATPERPRHSEASVVRLRNGSLLLAWSAFSAVDGPAPATETDDPTAREWAHSRDNNPASIAALTSRDDGATWQSPRVLVPFGGGINVMQPAFARLPDGALGLTYSDRQSASRARRLFMHSLDEGESWSVPVDVAGVDGYVTAAHDRLTVLSSGRVVQPVHLLREGSISTRVTYSDDAGRSWQLSAVLDLAHPVEGALYGFWEASVCERTDGSLLMVGRTALGQVYRSESLDGGATWLPPSPSGVVAPSAPALVRTLPDARLLLIHNAGYSPGVLLQGARTSLQCAVSGDDGNSWHRRSTIGDSPDHWVHYPSALVEGSRAFITYSVTDPVTRTWSLAARWLELS